MSQENIESSGGGATVAGQAPAAPVGESGVVDSPPAAAAPEAREYDPRVRLHELVLELTRTFNRRLMLEYLRLRRAAR